MKERSHHNTRWNYFLALESDIENIARYIELDKDNFETYSIELSRLLIAACAELDVLFKQLCEYISSESTPDNIAQYADILFGEYTEINLTTIVCPRYSLIFKPFSSWSNSSAPTWWTANNKIKHKRDTYFHAANLGNCLNAIAALFWVNVQTNHEMHCAYARSFGEDSIPPELTNTFKSLTPGATLFKLNDPWFYLSE